MKERHTCHRDEQRQSGRTDEADENNNQKGVKKNTNSQSKKPNTKKAQDAHSQQQKNQYTKGDKKKDNRGPLISPPAWLYRLPLIASFSKACLVSATAFFAAAASASSSSFLIPLAAAFCLALNLHFLSNSSNKRPSNSKPSLGPSASPSSDRNLQQKSSSSCSSSNSSSNRSSSSSSSCSSNRTGGSWSRNSGSGA